MVSYDEPDLCSCIYFLPVQKYVRDYISSDRGSFARIFRYVPSEGRDPVSERDNKVFCRDPSFGVGHSPDRQYIFSFL